MKRKNTVEQLDAALRGKHQPEPELAGMVSAAGQLDLLKPVPALRDDELSSARRAFLSEARARQLAGAPHHKRSPLAGLTNWLANLIPARGDWARSPVTVAVTLVLLAALVLAPSLALVNQAAHNSLPGDRLYGFKLFREGVDANLTIDRFQRALLFVEMIDARNEEIARLAQDGRPLTPRGAQRLEKHYAGVLRLASQLPDHQLEALLDALVSASENTLAALNLAGMEPELPGATGPAGQAAQAAAQANTLASQGLGDPNAFRAFMAAAPLSTPGAILTPTATAVLVLPTTAPTLVVMPPTATAGVMLPPLVEPTPLPTRTPFSPTQPPVSPSATPTGIPTQTDPPPVMPTPTEVIIAPTQPPTTPTPTRTPTPFDTPPPMPTSTPIQRGNGE